MRTSLLLLVLLWTAGVALGQPAGQAYLEAGRRPALHFAPHDYPGDGQLWALAQDARGLLYLGTNEGVLVYDGVHWQTVPLANESGALSLGLAPDGRLYVGGEGDLGYLAPDASGRLRYVSLIDHIPAEHRQFLTVWRIRVTSEGVFFQTDTYVFRWASETIAVLRLRPDQSMYYLYALDDTVYVSLEEPRALYRLEADMTLSAFPLRDPMPDEVIELLPAAEGSVWIVTTRTVYRCRRTGGGLEECTARFVPSSLEPPGADRLIYDVTRLHDGRLALGLRHSGVLLLDASGRPLRHYGRDDELPDLEVLDLIEDRGQGLWIGFNSGLTRLDLAAPWTVFDEAAGLKGVVWDVRRWNNQLYACTTGGLFRLAPNPAYGLATWRQHGSEAECSVLEEIDGTLYAGYLADVHRVTDTGTVRVWETDRTEQAITTLHGSAHDPTVLYVGLTTGVAVLRMHQGSATLVREIPEIRGVTALLEEPRTAAAEATTLWISASLDGLYNVVFFDDARPPRMQVYGEADGVYPVGTDVRWIDGRLRVLTKKGLRTPKEEPGQPLRFVPDVTLNPLLADTTSEIESLIADAKGHLWVRTRDATFVLEAAPDGRYQHKQGAERVLATPAYPLFADADGVMWLGDEKRLLRYDPSHLAGAQVSFQAHVRAVSMIPQGTLLFGGHRTAPDTGDAAPDASPTVPYTSNHLTIQYAAPRFHEPAELRYRVRLDAFEDAWSTWGTRTDKEYTNLPEGTYVFRVQARDLYGALSREDTFAFTILPPWYRTGWAYLLWTMLAFAGLAALVVSYNRVQTRRLQHLNRNLEHLVDHRTQEMQRQNTRLEQTNDELGRINDQLVRANRSLEQRTAELRQALEENKEILGITAHDLKNPLASIVGLAGLIELDAAELEPDAFKGMALKHAQMVQHEGKRLLQIIKDLLDRNRRDEEVELEREPADLAALAASVLEWNQRQAAAKQIKLHLLAEEPVPVCVDVSAMQRVIDNLISNAVKYSPPRRAVWIRLEHLSLEDTCWCRFSVRDQGPGLTEADKEKVFGRLQRLSAKPTGGEHSTGLGLFIVKRLIERHGGDVGVETTPDGGALFWFILPTEAPGVKRKT